MSEGIAFIPAENTTAAKPVYAQIIMTSKRIVFNGRLTSMFANHPPASKLSPIFKPERSLCCNQPIARLHDESA